MNQAVRHSLLLALLTLALLLPGTAARALTVSDVRVGLHEDKTRLVLELSEEAPFRVFVEAEPLRLVVDLPAFNWQAGRISNPKQSPVANVRQGSLQPGVSRVAVELRQPVVIKQAFILPRSADKPDRLVIDFAPADRARFAREAGRTFGSLNVEGNTASSSLSANAGSSGARADNSRAPANVPPPPPPSPLRQESVKQAAAAGSGSLGTLIIPARKPEAGVESLPVPAALAGRLQPPEPKPEPAPARRKGGKRLIVLDPGHGGVDPGALGANGVFEKHIALAMAKELKKQLEASGRYTVKLTRESDVYLRLYQRVEFARKHGADLFVSIHADSINRPGVRGASFYTLSEKASDEETAELAERENKADIIAGADLSHEDEQVASILIDLTMRDTMNQSKFFANKLADKLAAHDISTLERPTRSAGFAVLKAPDIPSVLIELGFMSNKSEAQMLAQPAYREKLARAIAAGIDTYFDKIEKSSRT